MKQNSSQKPKLFTMKVSPDQLDRYRELAKAHGISLSRLIKNKLDEVELPKRSTSNKADPDLIREIARIGNNLNQIARRCNSGDRFNVLAELRIIEKQLEEILDVY